MAEITVSAKKFLRLLDYLDRVGIDADALAGSVGLSQRRLQQLDPEQVLPAQHYSRLYREAAQQMQAFNKPIPWAAGIGTEAFDLMAHCVISSRTLGEALALATRYEKLLYPMLGYNMRLLDEGDPERVKISYRVQVAEEDSPLVPQSWDLAGSRQTVSCASGLLVWHAFCGWLTGQAMEAREVKIAAPYLSQQYFDSLFAVFSCPIQFDAAENTLSFDREALQRRVVQTPDSLREFLANAVYQLILMEQRPASTSAAIKSLVIIELPGAMPSFAAIAETLHMSESSLRRRLQRENTSYQALKDEVRCEVAIDKLLNERAKVADLAEYLGFTEPSSFVRSFKAWTGQTPRSYRERLESIASN